MRRLIIALDQDNFYVGVARRLDPSLEGRPIGITQKSLFATVSYEARTLGLRKLQNIREACDAIRKQGGTVIDTRIGQRPSQKTLDGQQTNASGGPELVLVDGEDLSAYRRASAAVKWIVDSVVGYEEGTSGKRKRDEPEHTSRSYPGAEKLGMDEVFIDVTALVDAHLSTNPRQNEKGETFFLLPRTVRKVLDVPDVSGAAGDAMEDGFWYPMVLEGKVAPSASDTLTVDPNNADATDSVSGTTPLSITPSERLIAATYLCAFLRRLILRKTGLSSSGGVAECKMVAKMMVGVGKPAGQAVWFDAREEGVAKTIKGESAEDGELQAFLDPQPVRNIQGYGSAIVATLRTAYPTLTEAPTIHDIRISVPESAFRRLFPTQGAALWGLLHGIDHAPVKPSPRYPAQISVEDSYASTLWRTWPVIRMQALALMEKLLQRMEEELTSSEAYARGISFAPPTTRDVKWVRYPSQIRFNIRTFTSAQSKSVAIPAFVFDASTGRRERAEKVMKVLGDRMLQTLLGKGKDGPDGREYEAYVVNIAVSNLRTSAPPPSITDQKPQIDMDVLATLPREIRKEMMQRYGLSDGGWGKGEVIELSDDEDSVGEVGSAESESLVKREDPNELQERFAADYLRKPPRHHESRTVKTPSIDQVAGTDSRASVGPVEEAQGGIGTPTSDDGVEDDSGTCSKCGTFVFGFAVDAHARWHQQVEAEEK